jgi:hydrogenase maturation protease
MATSSTSNPDSKNEKEEEFADKCAPKRGTLVLGLGNTILTDDAAGIIAAQMVREKISNPDVEVIEASVAGMNLLDLICGYRNLIVIDSMKTSKFDPGKVVRLGLEEITWHLAVGATHQIGLGTAMELGKSAGLDVPDHVVIFGIEVQDNLTFGSRLTPAVEKALPEAVDMVLRELQKMT